jgi:hypothetical protein
MAWIIEASGWYLRGSTWTGSPERATPYESREIAVARIQQLKQIKRGQPGYIGINTWGVIRVIKYEREQFNEVV